MPERSVDNVPHELHELPGHALVEPHALLDLRALLGRRFPTREVIHGIARHKLLDHYRRQERLDRPLAVALDTERLNAEPDTADAGDERAMLALASVAAGQRAALVLCYVDGYAVAEAAALLGKSVEAVESLLARGRRSFRRAYLEEPA